MKKRNIAFISQHLDSVLPPNQNSLGIWILGVASRLAETKENSVRIYVPKHGYRQERFQKYNIEWIKIPIQYDQFAVSALKKFINYPYEKKPMFSSIAYFLGYILQISYDLKIRPAGIIHIFNFSQYSSILRIFNIKSKIILRMSCEWLTQLDQGMIQNRLKNVDLIVGCSDFITNKIKKTNPSHSERCVTLLNGRDIKKFVPLPEIKRKMINEQKKIVFVGRVSPEKGVHTLIKALNIVVDSYPKIEVSIIGPMVTVAKDFIVKVSNDENVKELSKFYSSKSYGSTLKLMVSQKLKNKIKFEGSKSYNKLTKYYQQADIFVFPSIWDEPSGNPPIEAMATGLPVISTNTGGTAEYIKDGETGLLVAPGKVEELANAILLLLNDEEKRIEMGKNARRRVAEKFSFERLVQELSFQYDNISNIT